eukprot:c17800_g2_i1.p1 GENE.c17800_g2_i1~~c17800_g2_i1.p1  ORF type:complete len:432 (-),score=65.23 c17800_g2_i1:612-1907(-)
MGLLGTVDGSFFKAPTWVDMSKPPGTTSLNAVYGDVRKWLWSVITLQTFFMSPNCVWFLIALVTYVLFPYDFEAARAGWAWGWISKRLWLNISLMLMYFGFWHAVLYILRWSKRKFSPQSWPSGARLLHNVWYTLLGVVQWTAWEAAFVRLYATNKLPYIPNDRAFATPENAARMILGALLVPLWRDTHFYFAHRFLHIRALYKFVHSLHHRNTDIEPFAGLCMHPIEHLYYFSCVGPSLYLFLSPFHMLWNGLHLVLSPAASHSGWEDHWHSDQFHYLHHQKFECNYGTQAPLDKLFGTYRDKLGESKTYQGAAAEASVTKVNTNPTSFLPTTPDLVYFTFTALLTATVVAFASQDNQPHPAWMCMGMGALLAVGPIVFGMGLLLALGDTLSPRWPFHREAVVGAFGLHLLIGALFCVVPVYHIMTMLLC